MPIVTILIVLVVAGVAMYLLNAFVPMPRPFHIIINVVVVLALVIWLLNIFGLVSMPIGQYRGRGVGCQLR